MPTCKSCLGIVPTDPRFSDLNGTIDALRETPGSLIAVLHRAQQLFGFLPSEVQDHVARQMGIPASEVYGVVTFYNLFNTEPVGLFQIGVCMGTACYVRGADRILARLQSELNITPGEVTEDGLFSIGVCRCIGACSLAPVITVGEETHGKVTEHDIPRILAAVRQEYFATIGLDAARQEGDVVWRKNAR